MNRLKIVGQFFQTVTLSESNEVIKIKIMTLNLLSIPAPVI
jgi:hypothetical protein